MNRVIAVLGGGTGLGLSVARRFGREGFRVALVARRHERLGLLVKTLAADGVDATPFPGDLAAYEDVTDLIRSIQAGMGRIDVVEYGPIGSQLGMVPATELDAAAVVRLSRLLLLTPVEVVRAVLPEMLERGDGALLLTQGYSALQPMPFMSGLGPVMAAARNYWYSLYGELAERGVYAGTLTVGSIIARSELGEAASALAAGTSPPTLPNGAPITVVDPDELAERYWTMYCVRDSAEQVHPASFAAHTADTSR
ncbi:SDR family NAD(P)-dependent oxidoreductase [Streptomyces sp. NPDC004629]|uniref:SDR family NAD(P)-dependent oxidoreductase n=1 Tax=Streptomyces sp. NPDC004629 TaxID=3364705 RepID=UPI003682FD64